MNNQQQQQWEAWVAARPPVVQDLARRFPPGSRILDPDKILWVIAYGEDGSLLVSETDPGVDYDKAVATRMPIGPCCVKELQCCSN